MGKGSSATSISRLGPAPSPRTSVISITRTIGASPHSVYRAWLDPALVQRWQYR